MRINSYIGHHITHGTTPHSYHALEHTMRHRNKYRLGATSMEHSLRTITHPQLGATITQSPCFSPEMLLGVPSTYLDFRKATGCLEKLHGVLKNYRVS